RDDIFVERRDINQRARIADRVVLVLVVYLIHADRVIARPLAIIQTMAECKRSLVKRGSDGQGDPRCLAFLRAPLCPLWLKERQYLQRTQRSTEENPKSRMPDYMQSRHPAASG